LEEKKKARLKSPDTHGGGKDRNDKKGKGTHKKETNGNWKLASLEEES